MTVLIASLAYGLHILSAVIWVGGMFFAYMCLRPSVPGIEPPPERLRLWRRVFAKFFPWVSASIGMLIASGLAIIWFIFGSFEGLGMHIHMMIGLGVLMMAFFGHLEKGIWPKFRDAVDKDDFETGGQLLGKIRRIVGTNLILGLIVVVIGSTGRYWGWG